MNPCETATSWKLYLVLCRTNIYMDITCWVSVFFYCFNTNWLKKITGKNRIHSLIHSFIFSAEIRGRLTLTSVSTSPRLFPQVRPFYSNNNTSHAAAFHPPRHHASVVWSVEINGFYFHGIAMVMNPVVNHRIARVTDCVINQDFFFLLFFPSFFLFFARPERHVQESERYTSVISQLIHVRANTHTRVAVVVERPRRAGAQPTGRVTPSPPPPV